MIYLFLTILFSSAIGLTFKYSEKKGMHRHSITTVNYVTASLIGMLLAAKSGVLLPDTMISPSAFIDEFFSIVQTQDLLFSPAGSWIWAAVIGVITGFFFLFAFLSYQKSIGENGIALSAMSSRLGVLIPMSVSIVVWNEIPSSVQIIGISLAIGSIILVNLNFGHSSGIKSKTTLALLFIYAGGGIFCNKLFQKYALLAYKEVFLFFVFTTALLISLYQLRKNREKMERRDVGVGLVVGFFNLMTNLVMIMALSQLKASVVFPITSAGAIITMSVGGWLLFQERFKSRELVAIAMTIVALVLINL